MAKRFLTGVVARAAGMPAGAAGRLAGDVAAAIGAGIAGTGHFPPPGFGFFAVRETPGWTAPNPRTGGKVE